MIVLSVLVPLALIGLIAWIAVGVRKRADEPFTMASLAALYAALMTIVGVILLLLGVVAGARAAVGFINLSYSYSTPTILGIPTTSGSSSPSCSTTGAGCSPVSTDFTPQRTDDIVLAITLAGAGILILVIHRLLARGVRHRPGGLPSWVQGGTLLGLLVLTGAAAVFAIVSTAYALVTYFITPSSSTMQGPFGDVVGAAVAFIPAWIVCLIVLLRRQRLSHPVPPAV